MWSDVNLVRFLMKLEFSWQIFEKYSNLMEIIPVEAELFHADGRTDMTSRFSQFCERAWEEVRNTGTLLLC